MMRRCAIGAAAAVALALLAAAPADAARHRFLHFNMCGAACEDGRVAGPAKAIRRSVLDWRPRAVSLNEVCRNQYRGLLRRLRRADYRMRGRFVATRRNVDGCDGGGYGNAILVRAPIRGSFPIELPNDPDAAEQRKGICVIAELERLSVFCSVHLANSLSADEPERERAAREEIRFAQAQALTQQALAMTQEVGALVLMGDLNFAPGDNAIAPLQDVFREVDQADNEPTLGDEKIDFIFVSSNWTRPSGNATSTTTRSDHVPLRGAATLTT